MQQLLLQKWQENDSDAFAERHCAHYPCICRSFLCCHPSFNTDQVLQVVIINIYPMRQQQIYLHCQQKHFFIWSFKYWRSQTDTQRSILKAHRILPLYFKRGKNTTIYTKKQQLQHICIYIKMFQGQIDKLQGTANRPIG